MKVFEQHTFDGRFVDSFDRSEYTDEKPKNLLVSLDPDGFADKYDKLAVGESIQFTGQTMLVRVQ